jgi:SsrA-binding protein
MKIEKTINILNKRAKFEYEILEQLEAGIVLTGTEIKALRSSKASITESFCQFIEGELYVINMSIDEYKLGTFYNHKIKRERKLLLHKRELQKWERKLKDVGNTIIPLNCILMKEGKQSSLSLLVEEKAF